MAEVVKKGFFQEVYENGVIEGMNKGMTRGITQGRIEEKVNSILTFLQVRFGQVPKYISDELNSRVDLIALQSLFVHIVQCNSIDEVADALK